MAKPVTGALSYNPSLDRPTVFLQSGEKRLLTEDDSGGGGSLSAVASASDAIDVTDPTGPTVTLDFDKTAIENGGTEEISVAGLSGELADPQRADTLVISGPTDLAIGSVTDGQYLTRSGSNVVGSTLTSGLAAPSEWWALPASAGSFDVEFNSSTLPSAFTLFNIQTSPATAVSPISGVDLWTQPAANNVRIEANKNAKRSWLLLQPRAENVRWFYGQKITLSGTNGWVFRSRLATHVLQGSGSNNASIMRLVIGKDDGSNKPALIAAGGAMADGINFGWESDVNTMQLELAFNKTSTITSIWTSNDFDDANSPRDMELVFVLRTGALSNTWEVYGRSPMITWLIAVGDSTTIGVRQGDTIWVGWDFVGIDSIPIGASRGPILSADYLRVEDTNANFLP